jgi:ubiquinone/menaquinone biosynthesis C-methylase UbiE
MLFGRSGLARAGAEVAALSSSDVVVDVGCGTGTAVRRARQTGGARAIGIDPNPQMLRLARFVTSLRRVEGVTYLEGSAESLPLDQESATVVWALQSVHHWRDRAQGLKESRRVLAPAGRLIVLERAVVPGARGLAKHGLTGLQADELARLVGQAGFAEVQMRTIRPGRRDFVVLTASATAS